MSLSSQLDIVLINYNTASYLHSGLASLKAEGARRVVVVDVASTDDSLRILRNARPWVNLVELNDNTGYGRAVNLGMAQCSMPYVLVLNADTAVRPGALETLARYLNDHAEVGLVGPKLLNADGTFQRSCRRFPGSVSWFLDNPFIGRLALRTPGRIRECSLRAWAHDSERAVPWVIGAAMAVRREAFEQVGGFSSSYFMYYEDIDLCWRLKAAGWSVHFTPKAEVFHKGGGSTPRDATVLNGALRESARVFYTSHYPHLGPLLIGIDHIKQHFSSNGGRFAERDAPVHRTAGAAPAD